MSEINETINNTKQNKEFKKQWVEKSAPKNIKGQFDNSLKELRKNYNQSVTHRLEETRADVKSAALQRNTRNIQNSIKHKKRQSYLRRIMNRNAEYESYIPVPMNTSPLLRFDCYKHLNAEQRFHEYNRMHKCPHGAKTQPKIVFDNVQLEKSIKDVKRSEADKIKEKQAVVQTVGLKPLARCYTNYEVIYSIRKDQTKRPMYMKVFCHCDKETRTAFTYKRPCMHCPAQKLIIYRDPTFKGDIYTCKYCRHVWYHTYDKVFNDLFDNKYREVTKKLDDDFDPEGKTEIEIIAHYNQKLDWTGWTRERPNAPYIPPPPVINNVVRENVSYASVINKDVINKPIKKRRSNINKLINEWYDTQKKTPEEVDQAIQQFGVQSIVEPILGLFNKLVDYFKNVYQWLVDKVQNLIGESVCKHIFNFMNCLIELLKNICTQLVTKPTACIYFAYNLLYCDTWAERAMIIISIAEMGSTMNVVEGLFNILGIDIGEYFTNKAEKRWGEPVSKDGYFSDLFKPSPSRQEPEIRRSMHNKSSYERPSYTSDPDSDPNDFTSHNRKIAAKALKDNAKQQNGMDFIFNMFSTAFKAFKSTKVLEHLKTFNTLFTGWKNIYELATQLFAYLPDWLGKFFTITDPRKRYGYDATHSGNPVYDMIAAYKNLLVGENAASAKAHDAFKTAWKASDEYILNEYQPNMQIFQLNKVFWNNANAIMTPGAMGSKPIPFVITLTGKPGQGKSSIWPLLLSGIIPGATTAQIRAKSYTRNTSSDFFDGYNPEKHKIFVYDDFGHMIDDAGANELISIVSSADFLPNFASINDPNVGMKGTAFASPIVVLNTNFESFNHCKQIADATALKRRLGYVMHIDRRYEDGVKYSLSKMNAAGVPVEIYKPGSGDNMHTLHELQEYLRYAYFKHFAEQQTVTDKFDKLLYKPKPGENIDLTFTDIYNSALFQINNKEYNRLIDEQVEAEAERRFYEDMKKKVDEKVTVKKIYPDLSSTQSSSIILKDKVDAIKDKIEAKSNEMKKCDEGHKRYQELVIVNSQFRDQSWAYGTDQAEQQSAAQILKGFGALAIVSCVYSLADYVDEQLGLLGSLALKLTALIAIVHLGRKMIIGNRYSQQSGEQSLHRPTAKPSFRADTAKQQFGDICNENIMMKLLKNQVFIKSDLGTYVNGFFLVGKILVTVHHFVEGIRTMYIYSQKSQNPLIYEVEIADCKIVKSENESICFIELPNFVPSYCDISKYLLKSPLTTHVQGFTTRRAENRHDDKVIVYETDIYPGRYHLEVDSNGRTITTVCDIRYKFQGKQGDCGNIVFAVHDGNLSILGVHDHGSETDKRFSYATMISQVEANKMMRKLSTLSKIRLEDEFPHEKVIQQEGVVGNNYTEYIGHSQQHILSSQKTQLRPSTLHNKIKEATMKPAMLKRVGDVDPMKRGINKFGLSNKQFPVEQVEAAVESISEQLLCQIEPDDIRRELTIHECLNGIPGRVESVDTSTSSGYPFSLSTKTRGAKGQLLEGEPGNLSLGPLAQADWNRWQLLLEEGTIPSDPWLLTLKDEKRPIEKVDIGKTRCFAAGSLSGFLHNKRLFGAFQSFFKRLRYNTFSSLGMNRGSIEWHEMIDYFMTVGKHGFDGDQEDWDGRVKAGIAMTCSKIFKRYIKANKSQEIQIDTIFSHAVFAILRVTWSFKHDEIQSFMFRVNGCMPSGWYLTFLMNSMINAVLMRVAWMNVVSVPFNDLKYFRQCVRDKYAGDDNLMSVADKFIEEYNAVTICRFLKSYDQIYTPATKGGELIPYQDIRDCSFLKTTTGLLYSKHVPLFNMVANLETLNWIRKCDDEEQATEDNCNDVLRNLFFYGSETFNYYRTKILEFKPFYNLITYYSLRDGFLKLGQLPDPFNTFGYTSVPESNLLVNKLNHAESIVKDIATKQSGGYTSMTPNDYKCILNEIEQITHSRIALLNKIAALLLEARAVSTTAGRKHAIELEHRAMEVKSEKQRKRLEELQRKRDAYNEASIRVNPTRLAYDDPYQIFDQVEYTCKICKVSFSNEVLLAVHLGTSLHKHNLSSTQLQINYDRASQQSGKSEQMYEAPTSAGNEEVAYVDGDAADIDNAVPIENNSEGVTLSEQQQIINKPAVDNNVNVVDKRAHAHLNEINWEVQNMLKRWNLVSEVTWSLSTAIGENLLNFSTTDPSVSVRDCDVPIDLLQNNIASTPFLRFNYFRCKSISVRFQLTASRFHQGRLIVYFKPTCVRKETFFNTKPYGLTRKTQLQYAILDPSAGSVVDFEIPFIFPKGYVDLKTYDALGQLYLECMNTLTVASGGSDSVEVKVYVSFNEPRFYIPRPDNLSFNDSIRKDKLLKNINVNQLEDLIQFRKDHATRQAGDNLIDNLIETILPTNILGEIGILDRPATTVDPEVIVRKDAQYMSCSRGPNNLERMSLEPSAMYLTKDQFGSGVDEMDMSYILRKKVYLETFKWSSSDGQGTILSTYIISPTHLMTRQVYPFDSTKSFEPTPFALSTLFTYWRGSMDFVFEIVGTPFHEGRIDICSHPNSVAGPADYRSAMSQYVVSHTVRNTANIIRVRVPFLSDTPWKRVWAGEDLADEYDPTLVRAFDYLTGCMTVRVSVPLKNPNNVVNFVEVNVYVSAGEDFELHTLSTNGGLFTTDPDDAVELRDKALRQSGYQQESKTSGKKKEKVQQTMLVSNMTNIPKNDKMFNVLGHGLGYTYDVPAPHFGEKYTNLREILKRYTHVYTKHWEGNSVVKGDNGFALELYTTATLPHLYQWLFRSYRFIRGPLAYKVELQTATKDYVLSNRVTGFLTATHQQPIDATSTAPPEVTNLTTLSYATTNLGRYNHVPLIRFSDTQIAEFTSPYRSIYHSQLIRQPLEVVDNYNINAYWFETLVGNVPIYLDGSGIQMTVFCEMAFADETRLGLFLGLARIAKLDKEQIGFPNVRT